MPEESQSTALSPSTTKSFNTKKVAVTVIIIAVVLVIFGLVGWYVFNQNPNNPNLTTKTSTSSATSATSSASTDPTANWKTLTDKENIFSIKYPSIWGDTTFNQLSTSQTYLFSSNMLIQFGFHYDQNLNQPRTFQEELANEQQNSVSKKTINIDGRSETEFLEKAGSAHDGGMVILESKDLKNIIWISMPFYKDSDRQLFDQILSTFKFL